MKKWLILCLATTNAHIFSDIHVSDEAGLRNAISTINTAAGSYTVVFDSRSISLTQGLPPLNISLAGVPLNSTVVFNSSQGFTALQMNSGVIGNLFFIVDGDVTFQTIGFDGGTSKGGDGSDGGGGALGAGGAIFVNQGATCTLDSCAVSVPLNFRPNSAVGGDALMVNPNTSTGGGGGGMLQGTSALYTVDDNRTGGGGGGGLTTMFPSTTGSAPYGSGGNGGGYSSGAGGAGSAPGDIPEPGMPGAAIGGGGGGGGANSSTNSGQYGGNGGAGNDFGGGGGGGYGYAYFPPGLYGSSGTGGTGGWGGGGGSCGYRNNDPTNNPPPYGPSATSVFGGGLGYSGVLQAGPDYKSGTGGDAYGGGVFVRQGGVLNVKTSLEPSNITGNSVTPGNNGDSLRTGLAAGSDLYLQTGVNAMFMPSAGVDLEITLGNVAGPGSIELNGAGLMIMSFTSNSYTGGTTIDNGTLQISSGTSVPGPLGPIDMPLPSGELTFNGGTLQLLNFSSPNLSFQPSEIEIGANTVTFDSDGTSSDIATVIEGRGTVIFKSSSSGGVLFPAGDNHTQTWKTQIQSGTLVINSQSLPTIPTSTTIEFTGTSTLMLDSSLSIAHPIIIDNSVTGIINANGTASIIKGAITGGGSLTLESDPSGLSTMLTLATTTMNTYSGTTSVIANGADMTVFVQNTASLPTGTNISLSSVGDAIATLDLSQLGIVSVTVGNLSGGSDTFLNLGSTTLTVTTSTPDVFAGAIQANPASGLIVNGTSKLTLTNANNDYPSTSIEGGTFAITQAGCAGPNSSAITFNADNTTFQLAGNVTALQNPIVFGGAFTGSIDADGFTSSINTSIALNSSDLNLMNSSSTVGSLTLNGAITGTGALTVNGPGTFTLNGDNTYDGSTTVSNSATLVFTGSNTYTGPTTVNNSATLVLSGNGDISPSVSLTVNSGGLFDITNVASTFFVPIQDLFGGGTITMGTNSLFVDNSAVGSMFSGTIEGTGAFLKGGTGTLALTGMAAYFGATFITEGTLALETGFMFTANPLPQMVLTSTGTLDIGGITSYVKVGDLTGVSGSIINLGDKTLYAGGSGNTTFGGSIMGIMPSTFIKTGSGELDLTGTNAPFSTIVAGGTLSVNGPLDSAVTVENGGTLGGSATIVGTVTVQSGGIISPGNSIGSQTYMGDLNEGGIYAVEVNNTPDSTFLTVTGTATLTGGFVGLTVDQGIYQPGQSYKILTAGALVGEFAGVLTYPGFKGFVQNEGSSVYLFLNQQFIPTPSECSNTGNSTLVSYINSILVQDATFTYVYVFGNLVFESCSNVTNALNLVSGSSNTTTAFVATINAIEFNKIISAHMFKTRFNTMSAGMGAAPLAGQPASISELTAAANSALPPSQKVQMAKEEGFTNTVWATGFGNWLHENSTSRVPSFNLRTGGFFVGYDAYAVEHGFFGAAAGLSKSSVRFHNGTKGHVDSIGTAVYGTWTQWGYFVQLTALGSYNRLSDHRHVFFTGFDEYAVSEHNDWQFAPQLGFGYDAEFSWGYVEPYALFDFIWSWEHAYTENQAAPLNLHAKARDSSLMRSEVGVTLYQEWKWDEGVMIEINETLAYVNRLPMKKGKYTASFFPLPGGFNVVPFNRTENLFAPSLEIYFKGKHDVYTVFTYEGEFGPKSIENEARVTFGKYF